MAELYFNAVSLLGFFTVFGVGLIVFTSNRKSAVNRFWFAMCVVASFWSLFFLLIINSNNEQSSVLLRLLLDSCGVFCVYFWYRFVIAFLGISKKKTTYFISLLALGMLILNFTPRMVKGMVPKYVFHYYVNADIGYYIFSLYFAAIFIYSIFLLIRSSKNFTGFKANQIKYMIASSVMGFAGGGSAFLLSLNINFPPYPLILFTTFPLAISYAIVKHRLMGIDVLIRRSLIYSILLAVLTGIYSALVFGLNYIFLPEGGATFPRVTDVIAIILVALTVDPLKRFIEKSTDKIFFKARYNAQETLKKVSETLASVIDLPELVLEIKKVLAETMKASKTLIYGKTDNRYEVLWGTGDLKKPPDVLAAEEDFIKNYLGKNPQLIVISEVKQSIQENKKVDSELTEAIEMLGEKKYEIVSPLLVKGELTGAIFLGEKLSQDIYSDEDIRFIEILSHQAALALENAKLYQEEKLYGVRLKEEVERATANLRAANEKLKELDKLKDEFVSLASHELRTPMTAIKSYVWMTLNGRAGKINTRMRKYLNFAYDSSERMIQMIGNMLNIARIESGRLKMEISPTDIYKITDQIVGELSVKAKEAGMTLAVKKESKMPLLVLADTNKLSDIFTNLIGNALKFSPQGGRVTISIKKVDNTAKVSVADTGIGISKENIPKLFSKFGRLDEHFATIAPAAGTGLGLYIVKKYIEHMAGKIWVDSISGKGATFTFSIPLAASIGEEAKDIGGPANH